MENYSIIEKAYKKTKEDKNIKPDLFERANETLNSLESDINNWDKSQSITFLGDYVLGGGAEAVSASGNASHTQENLKIFLYSEATKSKLKDLLILKQHSVDMKDYRIVNKIDEVDLTGLLRRTNFNGGRPLLYINRLLIMIFPEIFTTVAADNAIRCTTDKLGIRNVKSFPKAQYQIREQVNDYLNSINHINQDSYFFNCTVAWWVCN